MRRREFLASASAGLWALAQTPTDLVQREARRANATFERRHLILIELQGGNDGLNTLVPFEHDVYHRARPTLRISKDAVHRIDDFFGYAPELAGLARLHKEGHVAVLPAVGMESPDRSHFESLDRWHFGQTHRPYASLGYLARALKLMPEPAQKDASVFALGDRALPSLLSGSPLPVATALDAEELLLGPEVRRELGSEAVARLDELWGDETTRYRSRSARGLLQRWSRALDRARSDEFPDTELGRHLWTAAAMILADVPVPIVFVRRTGFDTHARQEGAHQALLREVDGALSAFHRALSRAAVLDRVQTIVTSEFGRRVAENGSRGTDHGSAGCALVLWGRTPRGVLGERPDLERLDQGDVTPTVDFRRILATGLDHLGIRAPEEILGPSGIPLR